jgi:hypothetical protein
MVSVCVAAASSVDRYASIGGLSNHSHATVDSMATQVGSAVATESVRLRQEAKARQSRSGSRLHQENVASG